MNHRRTISSAFPGVLLTTLILVLPLSLEASNPEPPSGALTWQQCVEKTARDNPALRASEESLVSSNAQAIGARSGFFPQVSAGLGLTHTTDTDLVPGHSTYSASLTATQNLFSGLQDLGKVQQAEAAARVALAELNTTRAQISRDLKAAFAALLFAKESVTLSQVILKRRTEDLGLVRLRFQSGRENKGSVLLSQAYLSQAKFDLLQSEHAIRTARATLAKSLGLDRYDSLDIQGDLPQAEPPAVSPDLSLLGASTPAYLESIARQDSSEAAITVARGGFLPTLGLSASWQDADTRFFPHGDSYWTVGANLTLPIFNGGRDYQATRAASASYRAALATSSDTARAALTKLEGAYATWVESIARHQVNSDFREAANLRAEIARTQYNTGLITFNDWDLIENDLINRDQAYLQSKRDRITAEADWELAQGKGILP